MFDFAQVLRSLKTKLDAEGVPLGEGIIKFAREGWNGKGQYIALQSPDEHSANTLPYIYIMTVSGARVPWIASQTDMLSADWVLVQ